MFRAPESPHSHDRWTRRAGLTRSVCSGVIALGVLGAGVSAQSPPPFDLDRDGVPDTVIRQVRGSVDEPVWGRVVVVSGTGGAELLSVVGPEANDLFGWVAASIGDIDGDGIPDLAVAAPRGRTPLPEADPQSPPAAGALGRVHLIAGADGSILRSIGVGDVGFFGFALRFAGDFDGDGLGDLLVGAAHFTGQHAPSGLPVLNHYWALASTFTGALLMQGEGSIAEPFRPGLISPRLFWRLGETSGPRTLELGNSGDVDGDGDVDFADLLWLLAHWGQTGAPRGRPDLAARGDIDASGALDFPDLMAVLEQFGRAPSNTGAPTRGGPGCWLWGTCGCECIFDCPDFGCEGCYPDCGGPTDPDPCASACNAGCAHEGKCLCLPLGTPGCHSSCPECYPCPSCPPDCPDCIPCADCPPPPPGCTTQCECYPCSPECGGDCNPDCERDGNFWPEKCEQNCGAGGGSSGAVPGCDDPCADDDQDGIPNHSDCDSECYAGNPEEDCACDDDDGDGTRNQDDCDSLCFGVRTASQCRVVFTPDPLTHPPLGDCLPPSRVNVFPGDVERLDVEFDGPCGTTYWLTAAHPETAAFLVGTDLLHSVQVGRYATVRVVGLNAGATSIAARKDAPNGTTLRTFQVVVGGSIQVEYDHAPTFSAYGSPPGGGTTSIDGPSSSGAAGPPGSGDTRARTSPSHDPPGPVRADLREYIHAHFPPSLCTMRVTLRDAGGTPRPNKAVLLVCRDGLFTMPQTRGVILTDDKGRATGQFGAHTPEGAFADTPIAKDRIAVLIGRAAQGYGGQPYTGPTIEAIYEEHRFSGTRFTGHSFRTGEHNLTGNGDQYFVSAASLTLVAVNRDHAVIVTSALATGSLENIPGHLGQTVAFELPGGEVVSFTMTATPTLFGLGITYQRQTVDGLAGLAFTAGITIEIEPIDLDDLPPGNVLEEIDVDAVVSLLGEIGGFVLEWGPEFLPFYPDVRDLCMELIYKGLWLGESPDWFTVTLSAIGLAMDAGYVLPPLGAAGNALVAILKQAVRHIPPAVLRAFMQQAGGLKQAAQLVMNYVGRIPGATIATAVPLIVKQITYLVNSSLQLPADAIAAGFKILAEKGSRFFKDEAAEGACWLAKHNKEAVARTLFDDFAEEVVEETLDLARKFDLSSGVISDDAVRGLGVAVEAVGAGDSSIVRQIFDGAHYASNATRQDLAFRALRILDGVDEMDEMVRFLKRNANGDGVDGAIFEATAAARMRRGEFPELGELHNIAVDAEEATRKIDAFTSTHAIQMKFKGPGGDFTPSDINGSVEACIDYIDELVEQAQDAGRLPVLVTNRQISQELAAILQVRGVDWTLVPAGL